MRIETEAPCTYRLNYLRASASHLILSIPLLVMVANVPQNTEIMTMSL